MRFDWYRSPAWTLLRLLEKLNLPRGASAKYIEPGAGDGRNRPGPPDRAGEKGTVPLRRLVRDQTLAHCQRENEAAMARLVQCSASDTWPTGYEECRVFDAI